MLGKDWEREMTLHPRLLYFRESETPGFGQMLIVAKSALGMLLMDSISCSHMGHCEKIFTCSSRQLRWNIWEQVNIVNDFSS